jgi:hypothetical protein
MKWKHNIDIVQCRTSCKFKYPISIFSILPTEAAAVKDLKTKGKITCTLSTMAGIVTVADQETARFGRRTPTPG